MLRKNCPCAACVSEDTGERVLDERKIPLDIDIESAQEVGRYAMGISFTDGHNTGIYRYELLRNLCECAQCTTERGEEKKSFSV
jgi:DUF971 family protein